MVDFSAFKLACEKQLETNIYHHSLAVMACMGGIYDYLVKEGLLLDDNPPKEDWQLAGLVHDIDYSGEYKSTHPQNTLQVLEKYQLSLSPSVQQIVLSHAPELTGIKPKTQAEWAIFCCDSLTGLITAVAFVYPSRRLSDVKASSVLKRFLKEPRFAAGTRRNEVAMCANPEGLNLQLEKFIEICLNSMQVIAPEIGL